MGMGDYISDQAEQVGAPTFYCKLCGAHVSASEKVNGTFALSVYPPLLIFKHISQDYAALELSKRRVLLDHSPEEQQRALIHSFTTEVRTVSLRCSHTTAHG